MIALEIARKNLASLVSKPYSFICKSHVSLSLSINSFTTSTGSRALASTTLFDILVNKHNFSPELASLDASHLSRHCIPERADSILSLLRENGLSITQIQKVVRYKPRILGFTDDDVKFKFKIFRDLGFCSEDMAKLFAQNPVIFHLNARTNIIPKLSVLRGLLGSDDDVVRVLRKSAWFLYANLKKGLVANVEILKSCGMSMELIRYFICKFPRCIFRPDILRKSIDKAKGMGEIQSPKMFILVVGSIASTTEQTWECKFRALRDLGFSDSDILEMYKKAPPAFTVSTGKLKKLTELLLATGKFDRSSIVAYPSSFARSIEKRYKPRLQILKILESRNLIEKWPSLGTISVVTDDKFFETFVKPYSNKLDKHILLRFTPKRKDK